MANKSSSLDAILACAEPSSHANVEVITASTQIKNACGRANCNYYNDGKTTDNDPSMTLVGFNAGVRQKLEEMYDSGEAMKLDGCKPLSLLKY